MRFRFPKLRPWMWTTLLVLLIAGAGVLTSGQWMPWARSHVDSWISTAEAAPASSSETHADENHGHDHADHDETDSIELSPQARRNIGLEVGPVELTDFERTITVPGVVVERPGRTKIRVTAPLTGVVTDVFAVAGETLESGAPLFIVRVHHKDLVDAQTEFLKTLEALDVENREIARLENITEGVVAGRVVLERKYERQKLEGLLRAQREALLLHGLNREQVEQIAERRTLLRELAVSVPEIHDETDAEHLERHHAAVVGVSHRRGDQGNGSTGRHEAENSRPLVLQELSVHKGDFVEAGTTLATLEDLQALYIEGRAFEQDADIVSEASRLERRVTALPEDTLGPPRPIEGLEIVYLSNQVETQSRALHFYVHLANEVVLDTSTPQGQRFLTWRFKPGQRMRLRVPVETWSAQIVLPVEAIADDGAETFAFVQNGDHFDRRPVHVVYRDQQRAVIANDGSLFPGESVAVSSAHQLQMALDNKAGGGVDPHAGHSH